MAKRIFIAEDDPALRTLLADILTDEGYDVELAEDGNEAKAKLEQSAYDLVVLDYMMPGCTGVEVTEHVRASTGANRDAPIVLLTAKAQEKDRERARQAEVTAYVVKPFRPTEFLASVGALLNGAGGNA